jgi:hypothetical protein
MGKSQKSEAVKQRGSRQELEAENTQSQRVKPSLMRRRAESNGLGVYGFEAVKSANMNLIVHTSAGL